MAESLLAAVRCTNGEEGVVRNLLSAPHVLSEVNK